jgi:hypothetical protein
MEHLFWDLGLRCLPLLLLSRQMVKQQQQQEAWLEKS